MQVVPNHILWRSRSVIAYSVIVYSVLLSCCSAAIYYSILLRHKNTSAYDFMCLAKKISKIRGVL
jgi:hypothetical protein